MRNRSKHRQLRACGPENLTPSFPAAAFSGASLLLRHHPRTREGPQVIDSCCTPGCFSPRILGHRPAIVTLAPQPCRSYVCFYPWTGADRLREDLPEGRGGGGGRVRSVPATRSSSLSLRRRVRHRRQPTSRGACPLCMKRDKVADTQRGILQLPSPPMREPATRQCFLPRVSEKPVHEGAQETEQPHPFRSPSSFLPKYGVAS